MLGAPLVLALLQIQPTHVMPELVLSDVAIKAGEPFYAAVVFHIDPGWHIYWQNPGDSGTPTKVTWSLPAGWTAGPLLWPVPDRFVDKDLVTYGYQGSILLVSQITPSTTMKSGPVSFAAKVEWMNCDAAVCQVGSTILHAGLAAMPVKSTPNHTWGDRLNAAVEAMPQTLSDWSFQASPVTGGFVLKVKPPKKFAFTNGLPKFFASDQAVIDPGYPVNFRAQDDGSFWMAFKQSQFMAKPPERLRGILVAPPPITWADKVGALVVDVPLEAKQ